jgi:hypothetical protein
LTTCLCVVKTTEANEFLRNAPHGAICIDDYYHPKLAFKY